MKRSQHANGWREWRTRAVSSWRSEHQPSKDFQILKRSSAEEKRNRFAAYISGVKIVVILLLCVYALRLPPMSTLPHADVLLVDMTGIKDNSRSYLYGLLDRAGLTHVTFYSMGVQDIRLLTTGGYRFIIIWGHAGINDIATTEVFSPFYHVPEQLTGQVGKYHVHGKDYFSLEPGLISSLVGRFPGTTVLLMGCNTMTQTGLAQAFVDKGASAVMGWHGAVSLTMTDMFVVTFFAKTLTQQESTKQAVTESGTLLDSMGIESGLSSYNL